MLNLNSKAKNLFERIKEKLKAAVPLSPEEMFLQGWLRKMQHRINRIERYRHRNAQYPHQSRRQFDRNLLKIKKAEQRGHAFP